MPLVTTKLSPPAKDDQPPSLPGRKVTPKSISGYCVFERADGEGAGRRDADLAGGEGGEEVGAGVGLRACRHQALLDHRAVEVDRAAQLRAVERRLRAVLGQDVAARGPDQRREGEDVAAAASAGEVEALDVAAERVDLLGVGLDLGPVGRALFRIEPGLLEQLLVPDQHRAVGRERQAVDAALVGAGLDMRRRQAGEIGQRLRPVGDVFQLAGGGEGRRVDQVERQRVGRGAAGGRGAIFRDDLGIGDDVELDLVLMRLVEGIDDARHEVRAVGAHPDVGGVGGRCGPCSDQMLAARASPAIMVFMVLLLMVRLLPVAAALPSAGVCFSAVRWTAA